jgi:hypothetical protein
MKTIISILAVAFLAVTPAAAMSAKYFREKAELCLRLADGLSLNNPGRFQLIDLADDFLERAKELEANKVKEESIRHEAA